MAKRAAAFLTAALVAIGCSVQTSAQEIITVPSGGLRQFSSLGITERLGEFEALAVTYAPQNAVLYLDGQPLSAYRAVSRAQAERIFLFSAKDSMAVSIGFTVLGAEDSPKSPRILCINRKF